MTSRDDAVTTLEEGHRVLAELFARLPEDEAFSRRGTIGTHSDWSAKDLAAHMGIWETFALETIEELERGERPSVEAWFDEPDGGDRANAEGEARFKDASPDEIRARFEDLHVRIVAAIGAMSDDAWTAPYPDEEEPTVGDRIGGLLGADDGRFRHAFAHVEDLRAYVETT